MAWLYILFADLFEIAWPFVLKWTAPLSRWAPLFVVIICAIPANYLLAKPLNACQRQRSMQPLRELDCRNGNSRNGIFWREHESRSYLFPRAHRPRTSLV